MLMDGFIILLAALRTVQLINIVGSDIGLISVILRVRFEAISE